MKNMNDAPKNLLTESNAQPQDGLTFYEVILRDKDGLWGSVKLRTEDDVSAGKLAKEYLEELVRIGDTDADLATVIATVIATANGRTDAGR